MKYWDRKILIILEYYCNEYLIGQFFILRVSKFGMPIIMANWHIWPLHQMTMGWLELSDIIKWSTIKKCVRHGQRCEFNPRINGLHAFIYPSEPHDPLDRWPARLSQIVSALNAPEISGDRVKRRSIRFWKNPGYNWSRWLLSDPKISLEA